MDDTRCCLFHCTVNRRNVDLCTRQLLSWKILGLSLSTKSFANTGLRLDSRTSAHFCEFIFPFTGCWGWRGDECSHTSVRHTTQNITRAWTWGLGSQWLPRQDAAFCSPSLRHTWTFLSFPRTMWVWSENITFLQEEFTLKWGLDLHRDHALLSILLLCWPVTLRSQFSSLV